MRTSTAGKESASVDGEIENIIKESREFNRVAFERATPLGNGAKYNVSRGLE